ncbi:hypothetical protein HY634_02980 [Candidatus Uhrbacteria bacterium]|nr:hypothetical protein [Candidatus Uhrbacteria bacterium]
MSTSFSLAALVLLVRYRVEHHGAHAKRILMVMRDLLAHGRQTKQEPLGGYSSTTPATFHLLT